MKKIPHHIVRRQDGNFFNFSKKVWKRAKPLLSCFYQVADPRKKRGIRHELPLILFILFAAMTTGCTTVKACHNWALANSTLLRRYFSLIHGIPDPTTISYCLRLLSPNELVSCYLSFTRVLGVSLGDVLSADGKTMRGVSDNDAKGKDTIKHILSLFSHVIHSIIAQDGVAQKENEIPSLRRLLQQPMVKRQLTGKLLLADALHTNPETADAILAAGADYLLVVKGNQEGFFASILTAFTDHPDSPGHNSKPYALTKECVIEEQHKRKRDITTTVTTTNDEALNTYLIKEHTFTKIQTVGILKRSGTRKTKDGTIKPINETICFVSSRKLGAQEILRLLRQHWCIENNLHWVKDVVFLEDRQTLRRGNAPQNMSFLRSMCISICNLVRFKSISQALDTFSKNQKIHYQFLRIAAIM